MFGSFSSACHYLLQTTMIFLKIMTAPTGALCNSASGIIPYGNRFSWSVPVYSSGTSAYINVKAAADLYLALVPTSNFNPPSTTKYKILIGAGGNTWNGIWNFANQPLNNRTYVGELNAYSFVLLWISWLSGTIAVGTGSVVGAQTFLSYADPAPTPINYIMVGGYTTPGDVMITYCYHPRFFDQTFPVDGPVWTFVSPTELDCGRACDTDSKCQGYAVGRSAEPYGGSNVCNIFYSISGLQLGQNHVTYVVRNVTYLRQ